GSKRDWSRDVCSSDLATPAGCAPRWSADPPRSGEWPRGPPCPAPEWKSCPTRPAPGPAARQGCPHAWGRGTHAAPWPHPPADFSDRKSVVEGRRVDGG